MDMERHCKKCQTNKPGTEFSPTAVYCRTCVAANKAQSRANKKAGIQAPRGRPVINPIQRQVPAVDPPRAVSPARAEPPRDFDVFIARMNEIAMGLDKSATTEQLLMTLLPAMVSAVFELKKQPPDQPPAHQDNIDEDINGAQVPLDRIIDHHYYDCVNHRSRMFADTVQGSELTLYLSSLDPLESAKWEVYNHDPDYLLMSELIDQGYSRPHPFPPK